MDMDAIVFGSYTVRTVLQYGGMALGAVVLLTVLATFFKKDTSGDHVQAVECLGCGWRGQVSRYAGRCPKCNTPLGERRAGN